VNHQSNSLLASQWARAAAELGIKIEAPAVVSSGDGLAFIFACCLPEFGAPKGTLLQTAYNRKATELAISQGFTVSTMSAETLPEYDLSTFKECLVDWGWVATDRTPPAWYKDADHEDV
jgi:hypothetical protein